MVEKTHLSEQRAGQDSTQPTLLFVISVGLIAIPVLRDQIAELGRRGVKVHVAAAPEVDLRAMVEGSGGLFHPWRVSRAVGGLRGEIASLRELRAIIGRVAPDVVVAGTPKAGLYGVLAARSRRVERIIYTMHGLRLEGASGLKRAVLWTLEWAACSGAHVVHCVGHDLASRATGLKLLGRRRPVVVGAGSAAGIDMARFRPADAAEMLRGRAELALGDRQPLIGFVGRVTHDKGIEDLTEMMEALEDRLPQPALVVVGAVDGSNSADAPLVAALEARPSVDLVGPRSDVEKWLRLLDVLVLPSIREGLPTVVLEAASSGVPTVMYACTGSGDAVLDGETGYVVPVGDRGALTDRVQTLLENPELRNELGQNALERVRAEFDAELVVPQLADFYLSEL